MLRWHGLYSVNNPPIQGWFCINLYNGQTKYFQNNTDGQSSIPTMGQIFNYESPNQGGGFSYLWRTSGVTVPTGTTSSLTWQMLDGYTGNAILKIANVSNSGTQFRDSIGRICYLNFANLELPQHPTTTCRFGTQPKRSGGNSNTESHRPLRSITVLLIFH